MPVPYLPFLGFAPLDVWWRLLTRPPVWIPIRYWPRVGLGLALSLVVTILTLPERFLLAVARWFRGRRHRGPAPVFILGYYRSGTTHLQFLLDRDPHLYSPLWYQALSPHGFVVSWFLLRTFIAPFLGSKRPQDNVAFGADVPAEDDFALCAYDLVSCLPGRHIVPRERDFYDRYHDLTRLTPAERERFRYALLAFLARVQALAGGRRILLKSPSHTARVAELLDLFADAESPPVFIHISRKPEAVLRSNVGMQKDVNELTLLQDPPTDEEIEARSLAEYLATEEKYLAEKALIPPGRLAEIRLEDLQADPLGELQRVYRELNLPWTPEFEQGVLEYLEATRDFQPNKHPAPPPERAQAIAEKLAPLAHTFGHDRPAVPKRDVPAPSAETVARRTRQVAWSWLAGAATAGVVLVLWLALVWAVPMRHDRLAFVAGAAIGWVVYGVSPRGDWRRGLWSLGLMLATCLAAGMVTTMWLEPTADPLTTALAEFANWRIAIWVALGALVAYRLPSRRWR